MRTSILVILLLVVQQASAQYPYTDSLRRKNNRTLVRDLLWSDAEEGIYVGTTASYEMATAALGGEVKYYSAYYHYLLSGSLYANARHIYTSDPAMPHTAIGAGIHYMIFGLEGNAYLGGDRTRWHLTPKVGIDKGSFSIFYGYSIRLGNNDLSRENGHSLSVKYSLNLFAFKDHQSRKRSWIKHGI